MDKQSTHQKKPIAPARSHPTKTSVKSPVHQEDDLQGAIGNRQMGLLMETHPHIHLSSLNATMRGEMPMLGGMMPVSQGRIQRQPEFRGLSQEMRLENATLALPATGALVQRKLTLGTPGDMYEQEADRVARQVVDEIHSSPIREQNALSEEERIPAGGEAGRVQRQITVRSAGDAGGELSSEWEGGLQRAKSGGQPLSPSVKEPMERAFGADFGGVRVHTGAQADRLARSIQAYAFTTGEDVFFRQGAYEPGSRGGQELVAHELTHVVQQRQRGIREGLQRNLDKGKINYMKEKLGLNEIRVGVVYVDDTTLAITKLSGYELKNKMDVIGEENSDIYDMLYKDKQQAHDNRNNFEEASEGLKAIEILDLAGGAAYNFRKNLVVISSKAKDRDLLHELGHAVQNQKLNTARKAYKYEGYSNIIQEYHNVIIHENKFQEIKDNPHQEHGLTYNDKTQHKEGKRLYYSVNGGGKRNKVVENEKWKNFMYFVLDYENEWTKDLFEELLDNLVRNYTKAERDIVMHNLIYEYWEEKKKQGIKNQ